MAVVLRDSPRLEHLVCLKCVIFALQEEGGRVPGRIVHECDKVPLSLACRGGSWSPDISMYLITEVFGRRADPYLRDRQSGGARVDARVAVCFRGGRVQFDSCDGSTGDQFAGAFNSNVPKASVQFHDRHGLYSIGGI